MISTSSAVRQTPQMSGMPNSRLSAMAEPITSARSQAAMAISQRTQSTKRHRARVVVAARLGQVAPGDDAELERQRLEQDRHQVREQDDTEQRVAEARAAGEIGGPVARVHVADRHHVARARKGQRLAPERDPHGHRDGVMRLGEARHGARIAPPFDLIHWRRGYGTHLEALSRQRSTCASDWPTTWISPRDSMVTGPPNGCRSSTVSTAPGRRPSVAR